VKSNKKGEWVQIGLFPGEYSITAEKDANKGTVGTRVSIGENPEVVIRVGAAAPSPEASAKAVALQKSFDEGVALSKSGDFDGSIAKFNEAIAQAPNCHDCYYNIGYAHMQKKEWEKAEGAFKKATELKPDYAEAWNGLANTYNQQKKLDLALEASANAAKYGGGGAAGGGGSASALYNQGVILWNQGKYPEAKEKFEAAAKADPTYSDAHYRLGMANLNLGDMPGAAAAFEAYLKAAPTGQYAEQVKGILTSIKK
jgi:tetratricopeptide (TPR) repeat protein